MAHSIPVLLPSFHRKEGWGSEVTNVLLKSTWKLGFMTTKSVIHTNPCNLPKTEEKRTEHLTDTRFDQNCF